MDLRCTCLGLDCRYVFGYGKGYLSYVATVLEIAKGLFDIVGVEICDGVGSFQLPLPIETEGSFNYTNNMSVAARIVCW